MGLTHILQCGLCFDYIFFSPEFIEIRCVICEINEPFQLTGKGMSPASLLRRIYLLPASSARAPDLNGTFLYLSKTTFPLNIQKGPD